MLNDFADNKVMRLAVQYTLRRVQDFARHVGEAEQSDDITMMALRRN